MPMNLPNVLTLLRVLAIPAVVMCFYLPIAEGRQLAAVLFAVACITDWLDGYLARRLGQTSRFGAFLDPVADKLLVAVSLILLVEDRPNAWMSVLVAIIIGREITISALREWMAELGKRASVAVGAVGKFKTAAQMTSIALMLWKAPLFGLPIYAGGLLLLAVAAVLTVWSMMIYLIAAWPHLRDADD